MDVDSRHQHPADEAARDLTRRAFVGLGAAGSAALLAGASGCSSPAGQAGETGVGSSVPDFELTEVPLAQLQQAMAEGSRTSASITRLYLDRIAEVDSGGPALRSVIETNPDAIAMAEKLDRERASGSVRGPLHGIPILLKDNIATSDRTTTTAGSWALEGSIPFEESFVAARLRAAGAVLLGKANLSEWANFRSTRSSSGWSGRGGQCKNPYALDRNPCGSSSGSGAATAASLCAAAVGTETDGSIVCPSSANGLVGIKPTVGLVSRSRIIPISHTQDTAGPMARTVRDAAILLGGLTGVDPSDPATAASQGRAESDYTQYLVEGGLSGARIGVARGFMGFHPDVDALMESAIEAMSAAGATMVDPADIETRAHLGGPEYQVLLHEFKAGLDAYLGSLPEGDSVRSLAQLIEFNEANRSREMPYFGQEILIAAQEKGPLTERAYLDALEEARRLSRDEGIDATMGAHELDAIIAPTGGPAWVTDLVNGDHFGGGSSGPAAISGYPNVTVPMGYVFGLPVGLSIFGRPWTEATLIRLAYGFEQATRHRTAPAFLPVAEL